MSICWPYAPASRIGHTMILSLFRFDAFVSPFLRRIVGLGYFCGTVHFGTILLVLFSSIIMSCNIVLLRWSHGVSFAAPPPTFVTSAAQYQFWHRVGCCVLLRGVRRF